MSDTPQKGGVAPPKNLKGIVHLIDDIFWNVGINTGTSSSLMAHRGKFREKTFKKRKRKWALKHFRDAVTDVVTAL